jgi:serine/threonine-protein kinase
VDREDFLRAERLFHQALNVQGDARASWLRDACGADDALFARVSGLLDRHDEADGWPSLDAAIVQDLDEAAVGDLAHRTPPEVIGPYRVVRELGRGGMGIVYLAERTDVGKRVALKLLRAQLLTDDLRARFEAERRILARLEHPNIASLLDAGVAADGTPYFALELVEGVPITQHCRREHLDVRGRVALVLRLCAAVQYAHRHLVVHRDIKPGNVLVTGDGRLKLLDFGVAKLLAAVDEQERLATPTRIFTPVYAAPEQVTGQPVTTATDVYQIGAVLYELLAGVPPFDPGLSPAGALRAITEQDPPPPSAAPALAHAEMGSPEGREALRLRRSVRGDLDGIVLTCMEKRAERRYASVDALADDLRRFLDGQAVRARPAGPLYRARKFARRHRVLTAAGIAAVLWASTATLQGVAILRQRDRAEAAAADARLEAQRARAVTDLLVELFEAGNPGDRRADSLTAQDILARGVERAAELDDQPDIQATLFAVTGRIHSNLGDYAGAEAQLRLALDLAGRTGELDDELVRRMRQDLGATLVVQGRNEEAVPFLRAAVRDPDDPLDRADLISHRALNQLYTALHALGRFDEADSVFASWQDRLARSPVRDAGVALALKRQGQILGYRGDYPRAVVMLREAVAMHRSVYGERHVNTADALDVLAGVHLAAGDAPAADSISALALELRRSQFAPPHRQLAFSIGQRGRALILREDLAAAESLLREAVAMEEELDGAGTMAYVARDFELADLLHAAGRYEEAEARLRTVLAWWTEHHGADYPITVRREAALAAVLRDAGRFSEAEEILLARYRRLAPSDDVDAADGGQGDVSGALGTLVDLYTAWGRTDLAARYRALLPDTLMKR